MPLYNPHVQEFLQSVCKEIRFKSMHNRIIKELMDHIEDQKDEYIKQGMEEDVAVLKAVEQMGDPVVVGKQLDKTHRPKTEWSIVSIAAMLVVLGGVVQYFLSAVNTNNADMFFHFLLYAPIGIAACAIMCFFDYTLLGRYSRILYLLLFTATMVGLQILSKEHRAYTHAYYPVLLFIPAFAGILYSFKNKGYFGILASGIFYAGAAGICFLMATFPGLLLLTLSCLVLLTVAIEKGFFGVNKKVGLAIVYVPTAITLIFTIINMPATLRSRFSSMANPELDPLGYGYQHLMVKRLFSSSQPLGEAALYGNIAPLRISQLLPGWATDFSLTYIIARLGYVAGLAIVTMLLILIVRMFISVMQQKNAYGFLASFSACLAITGQTVLYVLSNMGVIAPFSGNLPFVSFGGVGFVINMMLIGLLLSVYRRTDVVKDTLQNNSSSARVFTLVDGKLIIDFGAKARNIVEEEQIE